MDISPSSSMSRADLRRGQDVQHLVDLVLAFGWVPFASIGWLLRNDVDGVARFVSLTLLISFLHQPLTLALVYGDGRNFALRRRVFTWAPLVLLGAIAAAQHVSLTLLAIVAGLWNIEHTLMQRYGIIRIHGRKAGEEDGRLEKVVLFSWLALTLVWIAADGRTLSHLERAGISGKNRRGVMVLTDLRTVAIWILPIVAVVAIVVTGRWVLAESRRTLGGSVAKRVYMASTAALFVTIVADPVAGLLGFVGAHAVEYFVIVHRSVHSKYVSAEVDGGAPVGHAFRRLGTIGFFVVYLAGIVGGLAIVDRVTSPAQYTATILTVGGMHVLYDGFIWKRPSSIKASMLVASS